MFFLFVSLDDRLYHIWLAFLLENCSSSDKLSYVTKIHESLANAMQIRALLWVSKKVSRDPCGLQTAQEVQQI